MNKPRLGLTNSRLVNPISEARVSRSKADQVSKKSSSSRNFLRAGANSVCSRPSVAHQRERRREGKLLQFGTKRKEECVAKLDPLNGVKGSNALDLNKDGRGGSMATSQWAHEEKKAAVQAEMDRMTKLPANSSYATHRMRVLNKIFHLMSIQRTPSQTEELELLFAGLSL